MYEVIKPELTKEYLSRAVDGRMVAIIKEHLQGFQSIVDVACGSGLYGGYLRQQTEVVFGIDYDINLVASAKLKESYTEVFCDDILKIKKYVESVDAVFCSEFLEHVQTEKLRPVISVLESITKEKIVITVPNPLSPHFKNDPTHILNYSLFSLRRLLNESSDFEYKLYPLGLADYNLKKKVYRAANAILSRVAFVSPTVLYVGRRLRK